MILSVWRVQCDASDTHPLPSSTARLSEMLWPGCGAPGEISFRGINLESAGLTEISVFGLICQCCTEMLLLGAGLKPAGRTLLPGGVSISRGVPFGSPKKLEQNCLE